MRFLCDMGVSRRVSEWLVGQGHASSHLGDEGLARLPNGEIFAKAIAEHRVILTFDLDFGEIAAMAGGRITSVVVFRLQNTRAAHVIERLSTALFEDSEQLEKGAIVTVEETRLRIRELPVRRDEGRKS
jgi:predicted nuclease of predicted toxin-antitoxin system